MTSAQIRPYRRKGDDYAQTLRLKRELASLRRKRKAFYLTLPELESILRWKLRSQYARSTKFRKKYLKDGLVRAVARSVQLPKQEQRH